MMIDQTVLEQLHAARAAEKQQALYYRALSTLAEGSDAQLAEDLNGLLADEQHHLSRLTARLVELDQTLEELPSTLPAVSLQGWKEIARERELSEVERYTHLLTCELDDGTRGLVEEILLAETQHAQSLAGKYMSA